MEPTFDVDAMIEAQNKYADELTDKVIDIAKRVQGEVNPDNFDTVFNAIVAVIHANEIERNRPRAYFGGADAKIQSPGFW
jgi:hypothetical protein